MTFLYLPSSDDLIAFPAGAGHPRPPLLQKARPAEQYPLARELAGSSRSALLRARIGAGTVAGLPSDIVDVADDAADPTLPATCPAFRCRGHVKGSDKDARLVLDVLDRDGRRTDGWTLSGAIEQAAQWAEVSLRAQVAGQDWETSAGHVSVIQEGPAAWIYVLDAAAADTAARRGIRLSEPAGLEIHDGIRREDDRVVVAVEARFVPADDSAARVFAVHHAVRTLVDQDPASLTTHALPAATAAASAAHGLTDDPLTSEEVKQRLWDGGHYRHVYALRAAEDFPYDRAPDDS
jgi:hypothetical protein